MTDDLSDIRTFIYIRCDEWLMTIIESRGFYIYYKLSFAIVKRIVFKSQSVLNYARKPQDFVIIVAIFSVGAKA